MKDLISIIVPIYNVEDYLERCILSILKQSYKNFELILVDDGSPDGCPQICDKWTKIDKRIKVIHKENGGLSDARNAGMKLAKGKYIIFVDSDDWVSSLYLECLLNVAIDTDADIVECEIVRTEKYLAEGETISVNNIKSELFETEHALSELIQEKNFHQYVWNKIYKRSIICDILFEKGKLNEDEFWTYQAFGNARRIVKINAPLYYYFQRGDSIMGTNYSVRRLDAIEAKICRQKYVEERFQNLQKIAAVDLYMSCIYQGQMVLLSLQGEDFLFAKTKINMFMKNIKISLNDIRRDQLQIKLWICLSKISFWWTCKIRNFLKKGF